MNINNCKPIDVRYMYMYICTTNIDQCIPMQKYIINSNYYSITYKT